MRDKKHHSMHPLQKIAIGLIIIGFFVANEIWYHDVLQIILAIGLMMYGCPAIIRIIKRINSKSVS